MSEPNYVIAHMPPDALMHHAQALQDERKELTAQLEESQRRCAMQLEALLAQRDMDYTLHSNVTGSQIDKVRALQEKAIASTDTSLWLAEKAKEERERIAQVFDDMGLRPYAEIVRDSNLTKGVQND